MNIHDNAHNLARAIKNSQEYKRYNDLKNKLMEDEKNKNILLDYRKKVQEIQIDQISGKDIKDEIDKLRKLEEVLMLNTAIKEFLQAEMAFGQILNDIDKILNEVIDINFTEE